MTWFGTWGWERKKDDDEEFERFAKGGLSPSLSRHASPSILHCETHSGTLNTYMISRIISAVNFSAFDLVSWTRCTYLGMV